MRPKRRGKDTSLLSKYQLLMWKNLLILWRRKYQTILELLVPLVFCFLLVYIRSIRKESETTEKTREYYDFDNYRGEMPSLPFWTVWYAPLTEEVDEIMVSVAKCMRLHSSRGFHTVGELEKEMYNEVKLPLAGVVFDVDKFNARDKTRFRVTIRFPGLLRDNVLYHGRESVIGMDWKTHELIPPKRIGGPRNPDYADGGHPPGYYAQKFVLLQSCLSKSYVDEFVPPFATYRDEMKFKRFSYPEGLIDDLLDVFRIIVPIFIFLSFLYPCVNNIELIVMEKETKLKATMRSMGLPIWVNWTAWLTKILMTMVSSGTLITVVLTCPCYVDGNKAVFWQSSGGPVWIFFMFYVISVTTFCMMMSTIFSTTAVSDTMTALIWFLFYLPFTICDVSARIPSKTRAILCLFHNTAMGFGVRVILGHEANTHGLQWENFFDSPDFGSDDDILSMGVICGMMLMSSVVYFCLALYIEEVFPGDNGFAKPWYFPLQFFKPRPPRPKRRHNRPEASSYSYNFIEEVSSEEGMLVIELQNIMKEYQSKGMILNGVNLKLHKDEITVILGENGAGKSTLMAILSGIISPTYGSIRLSGHDITHNMLKMQNNLGMCPQTNILFDDLTVREHIIFFSLLKGSDITEVDAEVTNYVTRLGLLKKINAESWTLSGGMKRKLSLAVALCGDSPIVFCDEPTSGIDPSSRRMIWDLLREEKINRTILLSTHFMDEADVLADRVAILADGRIKSYGSPLFLKNAFHTGYIVSCEKGPKCDEEGVLKLIEAHIPGIQPHHNVATELSFKLNEEHSHKYEGILQDLENNAKRLGILALGISQSTLEEIFLYVTKMDNFDTNAHRPLRIDKLGKAKRQRANAHLLLFQISAMFFKKFLQNIRQYEVVLMQIIVPLLMVGLFIVAGRSFLPSKDLPPLNMSMANYTQLKPIIMLSAVDISEKTQTKRLHRLYLKIVSAYKDMVEESGSRLIEVADINRYIDSMPMKSMAVFNQKHILGVKVVGRDKGVTLVAMFNNEYYHTLPLSINLIFNAYLKGYDVNGSIEVINHPLPITPTTEMDLLTRGQTMGFQLVSAVGFATGFIAGFYITTVVRERVNRSKLLQLVSGVNLWIYWWTTFVWDFITFVLIASIMISSLVIYQEEGWSSWEDLNRLAVVYVCFIWAVLPWIYVMSLWYKSPTAGFICTFQMSLFFGNAFHYIIMVLNLLGYEEKARLFTDLLIIIPFFTLIDGLNNLNNLQSYIPMCEVMCKSVPANGCTHPIMVCYFDLIYADKCCIFDYLEWEKPGVGRDIAMLLTSGLLAFIFLFLYEFKILSNLVFVWSGYKEFAERFIPFEDPALIDRDVWKEKTRVRSLRTRNFKRYGVVAKDLCKFYNSLYSVKRLCLAIKKRECFGLLGVNGAGKTTTFKMLAGDLRISSGDVWIRGYNLITNTPAAYRNIGYCPQFDALFDELTGSETLKLFLMMCGTSLAKIDDIIKNVANELNFAKHLHKQVHQYSGGNKRKLSTALALLGSPGVIYLDEPTTGMDPGAKRHLWGVVSKYEAAGKSIILTSHSMEECEALCSRLAIMVDGEFKCLGSPQHLKTKFSKGYTINVLLMKNYRTPRDAKSVLSYLRAIFNRVIDKETRQGMLTLFIPFADARWSKLFGAMESGKRRLNIETYSVSQTSLEQIFMSFTKESGFDEENEVMNALTDPEEEGVEEEDDDSSYYI